MEVVGLRSRKRLRNGPPETVASIRNDMVLSPFGAPMAFVILAGIVAAVWFVGRIIRQKNVDVILLASIRRKQRAHEGVKHVFFCLVDHFEPYWHDVDDTCARSRVEEWRSKIPAIADELRDDGGRRPQHNFFYPQEQYDFRCLEMLAELERGGYGSVEVHLHHDEDTSERLRDKLIDFKTRLYDTHGLLRRAEGTGEIEYGFIHGNWALDNSGKNGTCCGVSDEITVLKQTGCYADFTYPSAPHPTQPPVVNRIYYATDDPRRAMSHHRGVDVEFGGGRTGDLMLVTGPLAMNWRGGRWGVLPAVESAEVKADNPSSAERVRIWIKTGISVVGWPTWVFVKAYTHGAQDKNSSFLLGEGMRDLYRHLREVCGDGEKHVLHFVTARELYHCIKALEAGDREQIAKIEAFDYGPPVENASSPV